MLPACEDGVTTDGGSESHAAHTFEGAYAHTGQLAMVDNSDSSACDRVVETTGRHMVHDKVTPPA